MITDRTEAALMLRVQAGEDAALRQVYDLHAERLFRILVLLLQDHHQAEDVLQQVFLQAWQTAARYDPLRAPLSAWLTSIARSRALDMLRRRRKETPLAARSGVDPPPQPERVDLLGALADLTALERRAVELNYFGGYPHREIAQLLGLPLGTVKSTIRRALQKMRSDLEEGRGEHAGDAAPNR
jgi:RNA polymerase sigma-70 factor (ECF subfamily)